MTIVFGSGHRPEDAGMDYFDMAGLINEQISMHPRDISVAICGMAAGFDLAWGMEAINSGIEVWAVRPWAGHRPRGVDRCRYEWILQNAKRKVVINESVSYPGPWIYQDRNEWMVDNADEGLVLWNGKVSGGTFNCIKYADSIKKPYTNIYPEA